MARALEAATAVRGLTSPNPWVGAVVVRDGRVISVGSTAPTGGPHAEAAAISGVDARGATLYVTLEPCVAFPGKRTEPCADTIITSGLAKVVVALPDPDTNVSGRGIDQLRAAGVEVTIGDGYEAALALLRPYVKHRRTGKPYVIAKFAASLDGRVATVSGESRWITGAAARERAHQERARVDAILAGSGTVLADDPALTARPGGELAPRQPVRVVLDAQGRTSPEARLLAERGKVVIATTDTAPAAWRAAMAGAGAEVLILEPGVRGVNLDQLLTVLGQRGIVTAWVEGGGTLLGSLFEGGQVDETWAFIAPMIIGGDGLPAVAGEGALRLSDAWRLHQSEVEQLGVDLLVRGYVSSISGPPTPE